MVQRHVFYQPLPVRQDIKMMEEATYAFLQMKIATLVIKMMEEALIVSPKMTLATQATKMMAEELFSVFN